MAIYRDEVIILKARDLGDYDKILSLFGRRKGKFSAVVKGMRRPTSRKSGHLQTFNKVKVSCAEGKSLDIVTEAESILELDSQKISNDQFERLGFVGLVLENFLPEDVSEPDVYRAVSHYIETDFSEEQTKALIVGVLEILGFAGEKQRNLSYEKLQLLVDKILDRA